MLSDYLEFWDGLLERAFGDGWAPVRSSAASSPAPLNWDFRLTNGGNVTVAAGGRVDVTITAERTAGTTAGNVTINPYREDPFLALYGISPASKTCAPNPSCSGTFRYSLRPTAEPGDYTITFYGEATINGQTVYRETSFTLTVTNVQEEESESFGE